MTEMSPVSTQTRVDSPLDKRVGTLCGLTIPPTHLVYLGCTTSSTSTHDQERQRKHAATISHCAAALLGRAPHALGAQSYHSHPGPEGHCAQLQARCFHRSPLTGTFSS